MIALLRRLWGAARARPGLALVLTAVGSFMLWWMVRAPAPLPPPPRPTPPAARFLSPDVELQGALQRLQEETQTLKNQLGDLKKAIDELKRPEGPPRGAFLSEIPRTPPPLVAPLPPTPPLSEAPAAAPPAPEPKRLTQFKLAEVKARPTPPPPPVRQVHLPAGSFLRATLLSGVFAPARTREPLPVLVHFDEAALGPNRSRIPLERCVAVAKAFGDIVSRRAQLQLDQLSCVLPDGRSWSVPVGGWVTGDDGVLGVPGELIERTGEFLSRVALASFLQGAAAGFAQAQTVVTTTPLGGTQTVVTGNQAQFAALQGLQQIGQRMASFFERQVESLVPVIFIPAGARGAAIIQNGVTIEGLSAETLQGGAPWRSLD